MTSAAPRRKKTNWTHETASAVMRSVGLQPLTPYETTTTPWKSKCTRCGEEVSPMLNNIVGGKSSGCHFCSARTQQAVKLAKETPRALAVRDQA